MKRLIFSRERLTEFTQEVCRHSIKCQMTFCAEGDEAVIQTPFSDTALILHTGDSLEFGEPLEGTFPPVPAMIVRKFLLNTERKL